MNIATRLVKAREKVGLSIYALSKASGVGVATISEIENSKNTSPGLATLVRLADVLNCSLDYLAGRTTDQRVRRSLSAKQAALDVVTFLPDAEETP